MRNTQVVKALSPLKEDKCVMTFSKMSWDASSASWKVPNIRRERLNTRSCTPASTVSSAALSPAVAFPINADSSWFVFVSIKIPPIGLDRDGAGL